MFIFFKAIISLWEGGSFVCVHKCVLTTTPNCSGSDKFAYSFSYLAKAFSCSCSGRCFTRFYKEQREKRSEKQQGGNQSREKHLIHNCLKIVL